MSLRNSVLNNHLLFECFVSLSGKKLHRHSIDTSIKKLISTGRRSFNVAKDVIVSLTSYGDRLSELQYTLYSLIDQETVPEKTVVWLAVPDFSGHISSLPAALRPFAELGVEFRLCENLRSYKKLIPALRQFPDKLIISADDDIYYRRDWLTKLVKMNSDHPTEIACHFAHRILFKNQVLLPYASWKKCLSKANPSPSIFGCGGGGCAYRLEFFHKDVCDEGLFLSLCPQADDVWFYFMALLGGTGYRLVDRPRNKLTYVDVYKEYGLNDRTTLQSENVGQGRNDAQIKAILDHYGISEAQFFLMLSS